MARSAGWVLDATVVLELCFRYEYHHRDSMIGKKVPGSGGLTTIGILRAAGGK